jgi:two-component system response regulator YesN
MYKMLLIEDEPATLEGIKTAVNWSLLDIFICGEATNGLEAYELIEKLKPDIVLCDIRMPKMDGITLISEIQPKFPDIKVIFLSGYSDKEYLKKAIKLNVIDYLYKPLELPELIQAVEKAKKACAQSSLITNTPDYNLALDLVQGWSLEKDPGDISVDLKDYLITIIIRFNASLDNTHETGAITIGHYMREFQKVFFSIFGKQYVISQVNNGYILHANVAEDFHLQEEFIHKLDQLFPITGENAKYMTVGISNPVESSSLLKDSFNQARTAVSSAFLSGYGKLILYKDLSQTAFSPSDELEEQFFEQININNMASAIDFLEDYIAYMAGCRPHDIPAIKDELSRIALRLNQKLKHQENGQKFYVSQAMNYALDIWDIKKYLIQLLEQILSEINELDSKGRIIFDVERYILENYDKNLTVQEIADKVFVTPNYLSHLYKQKTGRTINQFIMDVKMKKSRKLITETNMRLSEISKKLGFSNQNYFTKIFTKHFGVTPSTFRNKRLN